MEEKEKQEEKEPADKEEAHEEHHKKKKKREGVTEAEIQELLAGKDAELKSLNDRYLYLQADFENFKKLKAKEKQDLLKYGNEVIIKELIPVIDNLERALDHAAKTEDFKSINEGVQITLNEFLKVLERAGVESIDAVGKKFDPNLHEAVFQEEKENTEPDLVVSEYQKGYLLNGRLMRPSRVSVSKRPEIQ
jgi:molecular chaperone GrpE